GGPQILLMGPYDEARAVRIDTQVRDGRAQPPQMQTQALTATEPALAAYVALTQAGRDFHLLTRASVATARQLYAAAINAGTLLDSWRFYPQYLAAAIDFLLFDLDGARAQLAAIPADACAVPGHCHKAALLLQEIEFAQDEYEIVAAALEPQLT